MHWSLRHCRSASTKFVKRRFRHPRVVRCARTARACLLLGPWRSPLATLHGRRRGRAQVEPGTHVIVCGRTAVDDAVLSTALKDQGVASGIRVPDALCDAVMEFAEQRPQRRLWDPHRSCRAVDSIARDPMVLDVVTGYLGCRPVLRGTALYWSYPPIGPNGRRWSIAQKSKFHFDVGDWRSVNLFVYLTDVDGDCGPHTVVPGTHHPTFRSLLKGRYTPDAEVEARFPGRTLQVLGPRGTAWFEDTVCLHKHAHGERLRLRNGRPGRS